MSRARTRVLATLRSAAGPSTMAALAETTGLHANTLREHLEALVEGGWVRRRRAEPSGPGRPAWLYEGVEDGGQAPSEYAGLASALAASIHRTSAEPTTEAVLAGEEWGQDLARSHGRPGGRGATGARREVVELLDELGFAPEGDARAEVVRLTRCPLLEAANRYPDVVCGVHLGIARGALAEYGADPDGAELLPFSEPGACRLHLARR